MWDLLEYIRRNSVQFWSLFLIGFGGLAVLGQAASELHDIHEKTARYNMMLSLIGISVFLILYLGVGIWALKADYKKQQQETTTFKITVGNTEISVDLNDLESLKRQLNEIEQNTTSAKRRSE